MELLTIAAAIILILLGMRHLRKGLDRLFGGGLVEWMRKITANRIKAFAGGLAAGAVAPSSTTIAMMSVKMLTESSLPAVRMLAVLLGANMGITITVQLLAFRLDQFAPVFLAFGGAAFLFLNRPVLRGTGQVLLAFGLIFLAMRMIGEASTSLAASEDVAELFVALGGFTWLIAIGTALLAMLLQSSTASVALGLGLAQSGLLPFHALIPWVVGTNIGTALTILLAGWPSLEGRRMGVANLLLRGVGGAAVLFAAAPLAALGADVWGGDAPRFAADLHTGFNLLLGLAALPILAPLARLCEWMIEAPPEDARKARRVRFSKTILQSPALALHHAAREMLPILDDLRMMLKLAWNIGFSNQTQDFVRIDDLQEEIVDVTEELAGYLGKIDFESLDKDDGAWKTHLIDYSHELVATGVVIRRDLTDAALRLASNPPEFPESAREELESIFRLTMLRMEKATLILTSRDTAEARRFIREKEEVSARCRKCQRTHQRIEPAADEPDFRPNLIDHLNCLRRINSHITSLAYAIVPGREEEDDRGD